MKSVLLFSLLTGGAATAFTATAFTATLVSSDRFLLKINDQTVSLQDFRWHARNLVALDCVYDDAYVIQYFGKDLLKELNVFLANFPTSDADASRYMQQHTDLLKKVRFYFKVLRYSEDQKLLVSDKLNELVRASTKENKCDRDILYKDTLKTNFLGLLRLELYFRSRYAGQLQDGRIPFKVVRPSIDLFVESLDKQFAHEYFW